MSEKPNARRLAVVAAIFFAVGFVAAWTHASPDAGVQPLVCFFDGPQFTGASFCARPTLETPDASRILLAGKPADWSQRICSVQVVGGAKATLFEGEKYSGPSLVLERSEPDLRSVRTKDHGVRDWCRLPSSYKVHE